MNELKIRDATETLEDYQYNQLRNLYEGTRSAKEVMEKYQNKMIENHKPKPPQFDVGDYVKVRKHGNISKLNSPFHGPYKIVKKEGENNYIVDLEISGLTEKYHIADLEVWQGLKPDKKDQMIPQDNINPITTKQCFQQI